MAQLRGLGTPFGSPGGIINIPAPAGSQLAGQIQMRAMEGLGQALGAYLGQRQQQQQTQENLRRVQAMGPQQDIFNIMYGARGMPAPQAQVPQMVGPQAQKQQLGLELGRLYGDPYGVQRTKAGLQTAQVEELGRPTPTAGQLQTARAGDGTGLPEGTVYQSDPQGNVKIISEPDLDLLTVIEKRKKALIDAGIEPKVISKMEQDFLKAQIGATKALEKQRRTIEPMQPTQKAAQAKLDAYNKAKAVSPAQRTKHQQAVVEKYEIGQALVQINLGKASPTERTSIAETRASIDALDNIKELYDNAKTRTGLIVGRVDPILGAFGWTTNEQEDFMAATSAFRNQIIKEITGAQMSEVEAKRILKQVPQETDAPARWEAKWRQSKKNLDMLQKRRLEILRQSGLQAPGGQTINIEDMSDEELRRIAGEQ